MWSVSEGGENVALASGIFFETAVAFKSRWRFEVVFQPIGRYYSILIVVVPDPWSRASKLSKNKC